MVASGLRLCIRSTPAVDMDIQDIRGYLRITLQDESGPLWFPHLVGPVTQFAWERLYRETGLSPDSYSTTRLLLGNPKAEREIVAYCKPRSEPEEEGTNGGVPVEILSPNLVGQITDSEVQLLNAHSIVKEAAGELDAAFSLLNLVPSVWPTVCQLVRAIHVIDPGDNDTDVSFSDPSVPFSVFVSVPPIRSEIGAWRIAEAILHESMHLHLTLIARIVPLVRPRGKMQYSPWRGEDRDSEGIIQALYVFSVIRSFFVALPKAKSDEADIYALERTNHIESQIRQARDFTGCDELTPEGTALVNRMLDIFE